MTVNVFILLAALAAAQPAGQASGASTDPEEQLDGALRVSGYIAGLAYQCTEGAKQPELEGEVLRRAAAIDRLLGGDRAFYYSAAFGAGTMSEINRQVCSDHVKNFWIERDAGWTGDKR